MTLSCHIAKFQTWTEIHIFSKKIVRYILIVSESDRALNCKTQFYVCHIFVSHPISMLLRLFDVDANRYRYPIFKFMQRLLVDDD